MAGLKTTAILCAFSFVATVAYGDGISSRLNISSQDGTVNTFPYKAKFSNGSVTDNGDGTVSITSAGGGGGASSLETIFGTSESSPTATIKALAPFKGSVTGSTNTLSVDYSSFTMVGPNVIKLTDAIQSGATFYVSSGTVNGVLTMNSTASSIQITLDNETAGTFKNEIEWCGFANCAPLAYLGHSSISNPFGGSLGNTGLGIFDSSNVEYIRFDATNGITDNLLSASQFVKTNGNKSLVSFDLLNTSSTWSALQTMTSTAPFILSGLSASLPLQTDANKNVTSSAVDVSGSQATGVLAAGRFPALTGDITTSAGALATTAAATQANIKTFTSSVTFNSQAAFSQGLDFNGINSVSANYTVTSTDTYISCSASGGARTITLDAANALSGQHLWIDKSDTSANACTIRAAGSDTLDYSTTTFKLNAQGQGIKLVSDGSANWKAPDGLSATPPFIGYPDAPSAAQVLVANQSQLRAIYVSVPIRATGLRYNEQVQSGNLDVGLYDNSGILLAHSGTTAAPATGQNTTNFSSAVNIAPGIYYLAIAVDNATISFAKSSGNGVIGCNNVSTNFVLANVTLPGTLTGNCLAMVLTVTGGIAQ